eukprot:5571022-Amphidinium_carterae.1
MKSRGASLVHDNASSRLAAHSKQCCRRASKATYLQLHYDDKLSMKIPRIYLRSLLAGLYGDLAGHADAQVVLKVPEESHAARQSYWEALTQEQDAKDQVTVQCLPWSCQRLASRVTVFCIEAAERDDQKWKTELFRYAKKEVRPEIWSETDSAARVKASSIFRHIVLLQKPHKHWKPCRRCVSMVMDVPGGMQSRLLN